MPHMHYLMINHCWHLAVIQHLRFAASKYTAVRPGVNHAKIGTFGIFRQLLIASGRVIHYHESLILFGSIPLY